MYGIYTRKSRFEAFWEKPVVARFLFILAGLSCLYFLWKIPSPGIAIGVLGCVAAIMALLQLSARAKIGWTIIIFILLFVEIRAIGADRNEHERQQKDARSEQLREFGNIAGRINAAIKDSQEQFNITVAKLNSNLSTETQTFDQTRPSASVQFSHFDFVESPRAIWTGAPFSMVIHYTNKGNDPADKVWKLGKLYIETRDKAGQNKVLDEFENDWKVEKKGPGSILEIGANHFEITEQTGFSRNDLASIQNGTKSVYFVFHAEYSDKIGKWGSKVCVILENPYLVFTTMNPDMSTASGSCPRYDSGPVNIPKYKIGMKAR